MLFCNFQQQKKLIFREHNAGRISGVGDNYSLCMLIDTWFNLLTGCKTISDLRRSRNRMEAASCQKCAFPVIRIMGFGDDDFIPIIKDGRKSHLQSFAPAECYENIFTLQINTEPGIVSADGVYDFRFPFGRRVGNNRI